METVNYGQLVKERERGRVVGKTRTIIFGEVDDECIDTVYVERYNLTLRHGISRRVRKSLGFSKSKGMLDNHLDVYQCYNNLIRVNSAFTIKTKKGETNIERTPRMAEGITNHIWTWKKLLMFKALSTINWGTIEFLAIDCGYGIFQNGWNGRRLQFSFVEQPTL